MEEGKSDQHDHEVHKLNGPISNSTTRNPYAGEPFRSGSVASPSLDPISSDEAKNSSASSNLSDPSITPQDVKCPLVQEANSGNHRRASTMTAAQDALNLPDDRSLASAFKAMSFKKRIEFDSTISSFEHNPASFRYAVLHNSEQINKSSSMPESSEMPIRVPTMPNGLDLPNLEAKGRCNQSYHFLPSRSHGRYHGNGYPGFSNSSVVPQRSKVSSHSGSTVSSHGDQVPDFFCKLTSHGVNSLRSSIDSHRLPKHADNTSRMFPDDDAHSYIGGSLNLGIQRSLSSSSAGSDQKRHPESSHLQYDSLDNFRGQIHMLAKDLCGRCFLLKTLDKRERGNVDKIFVEIISHVDELMIHPTAHLLIKKLVEVCLDSINQIMLFMSVDHKFRLWSD
ncbi:hypothetical protein BHM03_00032418 [Ensete ventricosum]|nr:hypothetical protein BHM03_00032418 [Ensete ventricosum]